MLKEKEGRWELVEVVVGGGWGGVGVVCGGVGEGRKKNVITSGN